MRAFRPCASWAGSGLRPILTQRVAADEKYQLPEHGARLRQVGDTSDTALKPSIAGS